MDACVDATGLVLESVEVTEGRPSVRRVATNLDLAPDIVDGAFDLPTVDAAPPYEGGGSLLAVEATSKPPVDEWYDLGPPPSGFSHRGRYAVIPPDPTAATADWPADTTSVVDVWVDGPVFFAVDQGGTRGRTPPFSHNPFAERVTAGGLGAAEFVPGVRWAEVRADLGEGRYVRVYGTVDRQTLLRVARSLTPVEGGKLVYLEQ
jgi:hypothetical protein